MVKVINIDPTGKIRLSRKALIAPPEGTPEGGAAGWRGPGRRPRPAPRPGTGPPGLSDGPAGDQFGRRPV